MGKMTIETYRNIGNYELNNLKQKNPSCFNREVRFKKTRITVEEIDEDKNVLIDRLQNLWETMEYNHHNYSCMQIEAGKLNYKLKGSMSEKRIKK